MDALGHWSRSPLQRGIANLSAGGPRVDHATALQQRLCCRLDAHFLSLDPECLVAGSAVLTRGHQVPPRTEMAADHGVGRQEALSLLG
jgi:hypothetical protein